MAAKLRADYGAVLHMPVLKEGKDRVLGSDMLSIQNYSQSGEIIIMKYQEDSCLLLHTLNVSPGLSVHL